MNDVEEEIKSKLSKYLESFLYEENTPQLREIMRKGIEDFLATIYKSKEPIPEFKLEVIKDSVVVSFLPT